MGSLDLFASQPLDALCLRWQLNHLAVPADSFESSSRAAAISALSNPRHSRSCAPFRRTISESFSVASSLSRSIVAVSGRRKSSGSAGFADLADSLSNFDVI